MQMHQKETVRRVLFGKDKFIATVYPNIDYAFLVTPIVIFDGLNLDLGDIIDTTANAIQIICSSKRE